MISTAETRKLTFASDDWSSLKSDTFNQTYPSVRLYGRHYNFFTRPAAQNNSNVIKLRQHFNPNFHPMQERNESAVDKPKSSSKKVINVISNKAVLVYDKKFYQNSVQRNTSTP